MCNFYRIFFSLAILVSAFTLQAQTNYRDGYIVTHENDTVFGKVKDRKEAPFARLYKKIRFKKKASMVTRKYGPAQIAAYGRGSDVFESMWIRPEGGLLQTRFLSVPKNGEKQFLKVVVRGYLSCYQWELLDHDSGTIDEITLYKRGNETHLIRVTQGIFGLRKRALAEYFQDCPELAQKIENGELKDAVGIALFYNEWVSKQP